MKKSPYQLGQEARERNSNCDLNPFKDGSAKADEWFEGWVRKEIDLWRESGLTQREWERYTEKILK